MNLKLETTKWTEKVVAGDGYNTPHEHEEITYTHDVTLAMRDEGILGLICEDFDDGQLEDWEDELHTFLLDKYSSRFSDTKHPTVIVTEQNIILGNGDYGLAIGKRIVDNFLQELFNDYVYE